MGLLFLRCSFLALLDERGHRAVDLAATQQRIDVIAIDRLVLEQRLGDQLELLAVIAEDLGRTLVLLNDDPSNLGVDPACGVLAEGRAAREVTAEEDLLLAAREVERAELVAHAPLGGGLPVAAAG
ncbi:MAG: hypothetical protein H6Q90_3467 [Deltaproteobacteria bacterium]|nr:hypothetical protein [Deltaproteobacteria bacterium]